MFPNYCLGRGLMDLAFNQYLNEFYDKIGQYELCNFSFLINNNNKALFYIGFKNNKH